MIEISASELARLAELSSLDLTAEEKTSLPQDLAKILAYVEQLGEVDTDGVEPTYQVTNLENVWRDDEIEAGVGTKELLGLQPSESLVHRQQIKVPKVL